MRELILLRHAHAESALPDQPDLDRPLSADGLAEAEAAARWLLEQRLIPDQVLCSPARRTRETLESALAVLGYVDQRLEPSIYEATPGTLAALLDRYRDTERVLLVGHNPGLEELAARFEQKLQPAPVRRGASWLERGTAMKHARSHRRNGAGPGSS